jgi:thioester reductase-like protein
VKLFVTGATGFMGKVLVENLLSEPCEVKALVRQSSVVLPLAVK